MASSGGSNVENLPPHILRGVSKEVIALYREPPEGIKVFMNHDDITDVQATIIGPEGTPFAGGEFKLKLVLGKDFPAAPPKGYFLTKIFHPNVSSSGEICVNALKKDWNPNLGLKHIFLVIKCLMIEPNPESALNEEAGKLLLDNYQEFSQRAALMTEIHAKPQHRPSSPTNANSNVKKAKLCKEKKKALKRL